MTFEQIQKANETIRTTDIGKGKEYAEVNQRIKAFRMLQPNGCISTDIVSLDNGVCIIKATVSDENGQVLGTGTAYEKEGSSYINKTSYIENCETSAVGRALAMCGLGIETSIASAEEVNNAIAQQEKAPAKSETDNVRRAVIDYIGKHYNEEQAKQICERYGVTKITALKTEHCREFMELMKAQGKDINA